MDLIQIVHPQVVSPDDLGRNAHGGAVVGNVGKHYGTGGNFAVVADLHGP